MPKGHHAQRYMLAPDKRFEVPLKSAYPSAPRFSPLGYLDCKLRMKEDGTNHLVAVELRDEHTKVTR